MFKQPRRPVLLYFLAALLLPVLAARVVGWPAAQTAERSSPLPANAATLPAAARVVGMLPASHRLRLVISLAPRNSVALDRFVRERSNPASPLYQRVLTPDQFASLFSPSASDQQRVIAYLRAQGLEVTHTYADRLILDVVGNAGQISRAFGVRLVYYRDPHGQRHYANETQPTVPAQLAGLVTGVVGLRDDMPVHRIGPLVAQPPHQATRARAVTPHLAVNALTPAQLRDAYNIGAMYTQLFTNTNGLTSTATITGAGQSVALVEFAPFDPSDIATYDAAFGISATAPLSIAVDGGSSFTEVATLPADLRQKSLTETALDIEMIHAVAPGASVLVYNGSTSAYGPDNATLVDIYHRIVEDHFVQALSTSWGQCEADQFSNALPEQTPIHTIFEQAIAEGISVVAATGDNGAADCTDTSNAIGVDYPASDPDVIAVGGTVLQINSAGQAVDMAWGRSGGGASQFFAQPTWQAGVITSSSSMRLVPDVSFDAGSPVVVRVSHEWSATTGTSIGAPAWAALLALANQARYISAGLQGAPPPQPCAVVPGLGDLHQTLYSLAATPRATPVFRNITAGSGNGFATPGPGWNGVTGLGVPDGAALLRALLAQPALVAPTPGPCPTSTPVVPTATAAALTATPTLPVASPTRTPLPTPHPTAISPLPGQLTVQITPRSAHTGETVTVRLHIAPAHGSIALFEFRYPGRRPQIMSRPVDSQGRASLRVRITVTVPKGHSLSVTLQVTVRAGKRAATRKDSFRIISGPAAHAGTASPAPSSCTTRTAARVRTTAPCRRATWFQSG